MDCSTTGFPVLHYIPEFAQTHVHQPWRGDAMQPSHPLLSPSLPAFSLSQHQGLFQWVSSSYQVVKVLELQLQSVLPVNIQGWFPLGLTGWISLLPKGLSRVFSNTTVQKHPFLGCIYNCKYLDIGLQACIYVMGWGEKGRNQTAFKPFLGDFL